MTVDNHSQSSSASVLAEEDRTALFRWSLAHGTGLVISLLLVVWLVQPAIRQEDEALRDSLLAEQPKIVLLGNSMLYDAVNIDLLQQLLDDAAGEEGVEPVKVLKHSRAGTYTAYWYLVLKNYVIRYGPPRLVVIPFRDPLLTLPAFRTAGPYAEILAKVSDVNEATYDRILAQSTRGEVFGDRVISLFRTEVPSFRERDRLQENLFSNLTSTPADWFSGLPPYREAVSSVLPVRAFDEDLPTNEKGRLDVLALQDLAETPESQVLTTEDYFHLDRMVDHSFLPEMVRLCKDHGIQLAFLRMWRGPKDWSDGLPEGLLESYSQDMNVWLADQGVTLLDPGDDPGISEEDFLSTDHLGFEGREYVTQRLAQWFAGWGRGMRDGRDLTQREWAKGSGARFSQILSTSLSEETESEVDAIDLDPHAFVHVRRNLWQVALPDALTKDGNDTVETRRSRWMLMEDGVPLGPRHVDPVAVAKFGEGAFSHKKDGLYFSTSDGSDPTSNGRRYTFVLNRLRLLPSSGRSPVR
ncbi:MAG: hypothetical protein VX916_04830 [Planctomycetota bacterium]|nr:hypothetical protein [Planctomycetota bacterium]